MAMVHSALTQHNRLYLKTSGYCSLQLASLWIGLNGGDQQQCQQPADTTHKSPGPSDSQAVRRTQQKLRHNSAYRMVSQEYSAQGSYCVEKISSRQHSTGTLGVLCMWACFISDLTLLGLAEGLPGSSRRRIVVQRSTGAQCSVQSCCDADGNRCNYCASWSSCYIDLVP
jgi:hypothetical protein